MKLLYITPFAATLVNAARTHSREFDISAYDDFYAGYADPVVTSVPAIQSGEVFYEGEDPYVTTHYEPVVHHAPSSHGHGHGHGHDYHSSDDHYESSDHHTYHAPQPVYQQPERVYHEPVQHYSDGHSDHGHGHHNVHNDYDHVQYADESYGNVPHGGFWHEVDDFNEWNPIWDQNDYEERIQTEAEMMVALEAIRESLVDLDYEIDRLEDCISHNDEDIDDNHYAINRNDDGIEENDHEIDDQRYRVKRL